MSRQADQKNPNTDSSDGTDESRQPKVISDPHDIANIVLLQIDAVNSKKDDLTTTIKNLGDTTKKLVQAYAQQQAMIQMLQERVTELGGERQ